MNSGLVLDMPGRQRLKSGGMGGIHDLVDLRLESKHVSEALLPQFGDRKILSEV